MRNTITATVLDFFETLKDASLQESIYINDKIYNLLDYDYVLKKYKRVGVENFCYQYTRLLRKRFNMLSVLRMNIDDNEKRIYIHFKEKEEWKEHKGKKALYDL